MLGIHGLFQWEILRVWHWTIWKRRIKKSVRRDTSLYFSFKKLKVVSFWSLLPYCDWYTRLTCHWKSGRMKEGQHFLLLSHSVSFEENKLFIGFLFGETVLSLLLSCAISWALYPLNSTALPIFWQLNLPYFLVIISFLWSLNAHSQGSMLSAVPQEGPI